MIPKANLFIDKLRALGKRVFFVTNNSTKSRRGLQAKFSSLGINTSLNGTYDLLIDFVILQELIPSSYGVAIYLKKNPIPIGKKVYVVGMDGIGEELALLGIPHCGGTLDADKSVVLGKGVKMDHDSDVGAVAVGFDPNINYYKIQYAQLCLNQNKDCIFIASNLDQVAHLTDAQEWACGGATVGAIKGCTDKEPILVGKPSGYIVDYIIDKYGLDKARTCMVGDRLDTDILFGKQHGLKTILTLSGVTTLQQAADQSNNVVPDFYVDSIADLV